MEKREVIPTKEKRVPSNKGVSRKTHIFYKYINKLRKLSTKKIKSPLLFCEKNRNKRGLQWSHAPLGLYARA